MKLSVVAILLAPLSVMAAIHIGSCTGLIRSAGGSAFIRERCSQYPYDPPQYQGVDNFRRFPNNVLVMWLGGTHYRFFKAEAGSATTYLGTVFRENLDDGWLLTLGHDQSCDWQAPGKINLISTCIGR
ncbi:hypothetical protein Alg215_08809 [Pyrenophora tritici-repentis]|nr:hypothetical protein Alg215_08809 [Pyrenophora tritici-repentis]